MCMALESSAEHLQSANARLHQDSVAASTVSVFYWTWDDVSRVKREDFGVVFSLKLEKTKK